MEGPRVLLFVDPFCGAAGDMLLGAWVDLGVDAERLRHDLEGLHLPGFDLRAERQMRCGIQGTHVTVAVDEGHSHRSLAEVCAIVRGAQLPDAVQERSVAIFRALAEAEAEVHGRTADTIHFHEVGAHDAIVDVVGNVLCLERLGRPTVVVGPVHVGTGTVKCSHGVYPVPAPATAVLLRGRPTVCHGVEAELVTPTGAAVLGGIADRFDTMPAMTVERIGYGLGTKDLAPWANVVRVMRGREGPHEAEPIVVLETHIDDMNPEQYGHVMRRLFDAGALDVALAPVQMKENRPGTRLTVLLAQGRERALADVILRETTSLGVRWHLAYRAAKERSETTVATPWGDVAVKVARWEDIVTVSPEYRACREIAERTGLPLHHIYDIVRQAYHEA